MSWAVGFDTNWNRDVGYGVPATCDRPGCGRAIDRGLGYVCGGQPFGGEHGCGLYFCEDHAGGGLCDRCAEGAEPFTPTPDVEEWKRHKLTDPSWADWRAEQGIPEPVERDREYRALASIEDRIAAHPVASAMRSWLEAMDDRDSDAPQHLIDSAKARTAAALVAALDAEDARAGDVQHWITPVIGWLRSGPLPEEMRQSAVDHLVRGLKAAVPGWDPGDMTVTPADMEYIPVHLQPVHCPPYEGS